MSDSPRTVTLASDAPEGATMSVNISIFAKGGPEDVAEYLRFIASEVEAGETSGKASNGTSWEIDDYADETRTERVWLE